MTFLDETDEADALSSLATSKISSKAGLDEKYEALQHAEDAYYQNKIQKKSSGLPDKKAISEALREASKKRLSNALGKAQERLCEQLPSTDASAAFLEIECFQKYEKVGKTFYNSQVAATIRWLSTSNYSQICDRLTTNPSLENSKSNQDHRSNAPSQPQQHSCYPKVKELETSCNEIPKENVQLLVDIPREEKIELPPIPSFSEFAKKNLSRPPKRAVESEKSNTDKKMKQR